MRIAIVFEYGTLNGGEHSMLAVAQRLVGKLFEFTAIAPSGGRLADMLRERNIEHVPFDVHSADGSRLSRQAVCENLVAAVRGCAPDLVHANSLSMGRLTGAVADRLGVPAVAHLRDILKLSGAAVSDLNRNRALIAVSHATKTFHVAQGVESGRVQVLYNGVDCRRFQPRPATGRLKQELGLPATAFLIATIGQIGLRKGQDVLAEAAVGVAERLPDVYYLLVGERNSTKQESIAFERAVTAKYAEAGLSQNLHCLSYRGDVPNILNEIDLLVHPAHQEPLGRVLLEAAASGVPIVATDVGGTAEIVEEGHSARLIPAGNPHALTDAIIELHGDIEKRRQFAAAARDAAIKRFNIVEAADRMAVMWRKILGTSQPAELRNP